MPFAAIGGASALGAIGAGAGVISAGIGLANAFGGGGGQPQFAGAGGGGPFLYQPTGQPAADQQYQNIMNMQAQYGNPLPAQLIPQYQQTSANIVGNPYASRAVQGADIASQI